MRLEAARRSGDKERIDKMEKIVSNFVKSVRDREGIVVMKPLTPKPKAKKVAKKLIIEEEEVEEPPTENIQMEISEVELPAKKSRGRPKKYSSAEEAKKAKYAQTTASKKKTAEMRKKLLEEARAKLREGKEGEQMGAEDRNVAFSSGDTFEDKARKALIELGYEIEKRGEGVEVIYYKSGKKKGQAKHSFLSHDNLRKNREFEEAEVIRLAKKYKLPKKWDEMIRSKVGNGVVNDWVMEGRDKVREKKGGALVVPPAVNSVPEMPKPDSLIDKKKR
jgi:hypothetical protein